MEIELKSDFAIKICGTCGVVFYIPQVLENECLKIGKSWTCPNGHSRSYTESEADKYKRLFEEARNEAARHRSAAANAVESATRLRDQLEKCKKNRKAK